MNRDRCYGWQPFRSMKWIRVQIGETYPERCPCGSLNSTLITCFVVQERRIRYAKTQRPSRYHCATYDRNFQSVEPPLNQPTREDFRDKSVNKQIEWSKIGCFCSWLLGHKEHFWYKGFQPNGPEIRLSCIKNAFDINEREKKR